jgi:hypothetical protein
MKRTVAITILFSAAFCPTCIAQQTTGLAPKKATTTGQRTRSVIADLKPTIDNGQANKALISTRNVDGKDWLLFSLKKGSGMLYCGGMWILPATSAGGMWTDERGDRYSYSAAGLYMGGHLQLLPGAVSIDRFHLEGNNPGYTGMLDFNGSEYTFVGNVNLLGDLFASENGNPLVFRLVKGVGAAYVSGRGTVITQDGKKIVYP